MRPDWRNFLDRWQAAGLIDGETSSRISDWEAQDARPARLEWPVLLALILGGIDLGAGILLFVAANWDKLSPGTRFSLVVLLVVVFHVAGAVSSRDSAAFQSALHAIGTVTFGAAIAQTGQIFHLPADWPGGALLWAIGAGLAWSLLRDTPQLTLSAVLIPLWAAAEMIDIAPLNWFELWNGLLLLSLVYVGAVSSTLHSHARIALTWIGSIALLPLTIASSARWERPGSLAVEALVLILPLVLAWFLRRTEVWVFALFALWILVLHQLNTERSFLVHLWCAIGSVGLIAWGWRDGRKERINLGVAGFALSILFFYVSNVLDKLGRSASLITLGVLLLAGGWGLERARRRLVSRV